MTTRYPMPGTWIANAEGGIRPYNWQDEGHHLDLETDDDEEPVVCPAHVVSVLGFDPLQEFGQEHYNEHPLYRPIGQHNPVDWTGDTFLETEHPRGQPDNAGEFAKTGRGTSTAKSGGRSTHSTSTAKQQTAHQGSGNPVVAGSGSTVKFGRAVSDTFFRSISTAVQANNAGAAVHVYDPGEYKNMRCYLTPDGSAGYALKGDDIVSVFKHPESPHKKVAIAALAQAVKQGGRRLDCFDTVLPSFYSNNHFRAVARLKFNDEYAPDGWDYKRMTPFNNGRPDVVFMVYDPSYSDLYKPGDGELVDDYDEAESIQKDAVRHGVKTRSPHGLHVGDAFVETEHPRGQPENKGEFAKAPSSATSSTSATVGRKEPKPQEEDYASFTHAKVRKIVANLKDATDKDLQNAANWLWENKMRDNATLAPKDAALDDALRSEINTRSATKTKKIEDRAHEFIMSTPSEIETMTGLKYEQKGRRGPQIRAVLGRLPETHIAQLAKRGVKIEYVDQLPKLSADHPYAPGMQPAGLWNPSSMTAQVADSVTLPDGTERMINAPSSVLRHELGHAMDTITGLSYNENIIKAYFKGIDRMTPEEKKTAAYWLGDKAPSSEKNVVKRDVRRLEMFAELYAYAYNDGMAEAESGTSFGGLSDSRRFELFAEARKVLREEMKKYLDALDKAQNYMKEHGDEIESLRKEYERLKTIAVDRSGSKTLKQTDEEWRKAEDAYDKWKAREKQS